MNRTGLTRLTVILFLLIFGLVSVGVPTATAQHRARDGALDTTDSGEPTDPEEALSLLGRAEVDTDFDLTQPEDEEETATWFEALLNLLRELGLIAGASEESG